jgi:methylated-DNA-[protein]-cysteine S-methyltransferase
MRIDRIPTPLGPCWAAEEGGKLVALRLGAARGLKGRRTRLSGVRRALAAWFRGGRVELPLDPAPATAFARRVIDQVRRIPRGETRTYGEIARAAGRPGAARAVGNLMARNPILLFVPCHRVVGVSGPGGFSAAGGLRTKARLQRLESR